MVVHPGLAFPSPSPYSITIEQGFPEHNTPGNDGNWGVGKPEVIPYCPSIWTILDMEVAAVVSPNRGGQDGGSGGGASGGPGSTTNGGSGTNPSSNPGATEYGGNGGNGTDSGGYAGGGGGGAGDPVMQARVHQE